MNQGVPTTIGAVPHPLNGRSHAPVLETLFQNFDFDFDQVSSSIDPILTVQHRCQTTALYVQGIIARKGAFLSTNLTGETMYLTPRALQWSLGRSPQCAVAIDRPDLARYHAALCYNGQDFSIVNTGQGRLAVNGSLLLNGQGQPLADGDIIELEQLQIEFFLDCFTEAVRLG